MDKILVIAAHPDDEILGCGGTMARHSKNGDQVHVLILAEGFTARDSKREVNIRQLELTNLKKSAMKANKILGVRSVMFNDFPDNRMDSVDLLDVIKKIETSIEIINPVIIYTHHFGDVNIDHRLIQESVMSAARPMPGHGVKSILYFEIPSSTEWQTQGRSRAFVPNYFIDISATLELKIKALQAYKSEMREWPHPRSYEGIEHLAKWRGATVGVKAAESFEIGRIVSRL